jgi:hypothetical protein
MVDNLDAEVEYAIALYNGTGTPKDVPTAIAVLNRAARQNSPIAQNRLARILVDGLGVPVDKVQGFKWHLIAKPPATAIPISMLNSRNFLRSKKQNPKTSPKSGLARSEAGFDVFSSRAPVPAALQNALGALSPLTCLRFAAKHHYQPTLIQ